MGCNFQRDRATTGTQCPVLHAHLLQILSLRVNFVAGGVNSMGHSNYVKVEKHWFLSILLLIFTSVFSE